MANRFTRDSTAELWTHLEALSREGVRWFATTAARDAEFTAPIAGMRCFVGTDTALTEWIYSGTSWFALRPRAHGWWRLAAAQPVPASSFVQLGPTTPISSDPIFATANTSGAIALPSDGTFEVSATVIWPVSDATRRGVTLTLNCPSISSATGLLAAGTVLPGGTALGSGANGELSFAQTARSMPFRAAAGDVVRAFLFNGSTAAQLVEVGGTTHHVGVTSVTVVRIG